MRLEISILLCSHALSLATAHFRLQVLHTNDMHSRFAEMDKSGMPCNGNSCGRCYGGFPRLKTAVDRERAKAEAANVGSLFLNAGDTFQGTDFFTQGGWQIVVEMLSKINLDVVTLGNHEFDKGVAVVKSYIQSLPIPVVCCNLDTSEEPSLHNEPNLRKSIVMNIKTIDNFNNETNRQVGIIGYLTPDTKDLAMTEKVKFEDEVSAVRAEAQHLTKMGVNIIIALGHSGFIMDKKIAREVDEVDLVIGGHDNTFLYHGTPPDIETPADTYPVFVKKNSDESKSVPVVQAFYNTKYLGVLWLKFDDKGEILECTGNPVLLDSSIEQDPELLYIVNGHIASNQHNQKEVLGSSTVYLKGSDNYCRFRECELGNFVLDSLVFYNSLHNRKSFDWNKNWTDAPIAVLHSGAIRNDINKGTITYAHLTVAMPFLHVMGKVTISGLDIKNMFETAFQKYDGVTPRGEFLQVSGVRVEIDLSRPGGQRVQSVMVKSGEHDVTEYQPLDMDGRYTIIISYYKWKGGNGFRFTTESDFTTLDKNDLEIVRDELKLRAPISPTIEGRINVFGLDNIYNAVERGDEEPTQARNEN